MPDAVLASPAGLGTIDEPYKIATPEDLVWMSTEIDTIYNQHFKQINNIDMTGIAFTPIGNRGRMFSGVYDGCGRSITGLTVNDSKLGDVGLFGYISEATVNNINLINVNIKTTAEASCSAGGVAGWSGGAFVQGCSVSGRIESTYYTSSVGGIVGNDQGNIENCYSIATVIGNSDSAALGGITGYLGNDIGYIKNCYFTGSFGGTATSVGGIVGNYYLGDVSGNYFLNTTTAYGIRGTSESNNEAEPKTASEMMDFSTYAGWDNDIWYIADAYPVLLAPAPYLKDIVFERSPEGDVIRVCDRVEGETVSVYSLDSTLIGSSMVEPGETTVEISIGKITDSSGSFFVGATTQSRPNEGKWQKITYNIPDAPSTVTVKGGYKSVLLSWDSVSGAKEYKIYKGTESGVYSYCSTVYENTAIINELTNDTEYFFVVTACNDIESAYSNEVSAIPELLVPTDIYTDVNTGTVTLSWDTIPGVDSYKILYGTKSGVYPNMITTSDSFVEITDLIDGTEYYFIVRSLADGEESDNSVEISAFLALFSFTIPVKVPFNSFSLPMGWVSTEVNTPPTSTPISWSCVDKEGDDLPYLLPPHNGSGYMVMANIYDYGVDSSYGSQARFNMNSNLALSVNSSYMFSFYLYIGPSDWDCLDTITPQISTDNGNTWSNLDAPIFCEQPENPNQWKEYSYNLDSYKGSNVRLGLLATSDWGYNIYVDDIEISEIITVPPTPSDVSAIAGNECATISFTQHNNEGSEITGYTVVPYISGVPQNSLTVEGKSSPITVNGLTSGTTYTFRVFATNKTGNSSEESLPSNEIEPLKKGPEWADGYPKAGAIGTAFAEIFVKPDSAGTVYYAVLPKDYKVPEVSEIINGSVHSSICIGSADMAADTELLIKCEGLSENTDFDIYVVAEDNSLPPVAQETVTKLEVKTLWNAPSPKITKQPEGKTVNNGETALLSIEATGSGTMTYQWYKNLKPDTDGIELIEGAKSSTYNAPTGFGGTTYYLCAITNTDETATGIKTASALSTIVSVTVRKALSVSGLVVNDKVYDGTKSAQVNAGSVVLNGVNAEDSVFVDMNNVTALFMDENVGFDKEVTVTGFLLTGKDADKYVLIQPTGSKADITAKEITISMEDASFVYDGTAKSLIATSSDEISIKYTGNNKTEAGTYTVTATSDDPNCSGSKTATLTITQKELTVAGLKAVNKEYDGTTQAVLTGGTIEGIVGEDDIKSVIPVSGTFATADVGNDITVTIPIITFSGEKAGNYSLIQPTGIKADILAEPSYNITAAFDTPYDGNWTNKDLTITLNGDTPSGIMKYQYSADNGENWIDMTEPTITINKTTDEKYLFKAISFGKIESNQSPEIILKIDKEKPVIENILGNPTEAISGEQVISFAVNDTNSGVNKQSVSVFNGETAIAISEKDGVYSFTTQGNGQYKIKADDYALNTCETIVGVNKIKPMVSSFMPLNNETDVDVDSLIITFCKNIKKSEINGDIALYRADKTIFEKVDIQNNRVKISGNRMKIYFTKPFEANSSYYINIEKNIILDEYNNTFDGIADNKTWSFKTKKVMENISMIGLEVAVQNERYSAIVDSADEMKYMVAAKPNSKGIVEATIYPLFTKNGVNFTVTSSETGVIIDGNKVKITNQTKNRFILEIEADDLKKYTLIINKGFFDTKIETEKTDVAVESPDIKGAGIPDIDSENKYELVLNVTNNENSITKEQKDAISRVTDGSTVLYFDISLILNNITEDTKTIIKNTQNPVTIRLEIPKNIREASNFKVVRTHNGLIEIIEAKRFENYLEFSTDRFSQYAISYTKPKTKAEDSGRKSEKIKENTKISVASTIVQKPYIKGYSDKTFKPDNFISRAEAAAIVSRLAENHNEKLCYSNQFTDIFPDMWYADAIAYANLNGLITGYENSSYMPDRAITRAEFAVIIARLNNLTVPAGDNAFDDIKNHWAEDYIMALYKQGLICGYEDKTFRPDAPISRAEAVKILNAATGRKANEYASAYINPFSDLSPMHWAYYEILEAANSKNV